MPNPIYSRPELPTTRSLDEMLHQAEAHSEAPSLVTRTADGWSRSLSTGAGFRYDYDINIAQGGWEFHQLDAGISVAITDMVPVTTTIRRHLSTDCLVFTVMVDGSIPIRLSEGDDTASEMTTGFCTVYGLKQGDSLETHYESGRHLRWWSVFLDRKHFFRTMQLDDSDPPAGIADFIVRGSALPHRNVALSPSAVLVVRQVLEQPFQNGLRRAFLSAKAREFACHILTALSDREETNAQGDIGFSAADHEKIKAAWRLLRKTLDRPPNVREIAETVGLTRQRLQHGFRLVYGDTVGRVRDKLRMELALDLVCDSQASMIEITLETGYEHPASFTRAFKFTFGMSPIQMRRTAQDGLRMRIKGAREALRSH
ncbi:helix-turn-helix domain-containing protein [Sphingomonas alpina]|uniref:Helix-turn-helix transcriptional regulator n=1 Tax=Sphingomonas alpina TaxID=653931 RepID=A0A7H0LIS5_9SPHN|nr:AraC family transcriptional regulator [Sphingomonas alpina]QNQ09578.1 helix-turn-helix transcriptional regulator [Sphingomonas alpina]